MKVLVTGANGFVAGYLARELALTGHKVLLTGRDPATSLDFPYFEADLSAREQAFAAVRWSDPDAVVHLAGISNVSSDRQDTRARLICSVNIDATSYLCQALHAQNRGAIFLFASTGLIYRNPENKAFHGFDETSALGPVNDYGWSKLSAEAIARIYDGAQLRTYIVRPFNHTGPGQDTRFVAPSLAQRVIDAVDGATITVGDLSAYRDFSDVRDVVKAYRLILEKAPAQRTFVIGSGQAIPISKILDFFLSYSGKTLSTKRSDELLRTEQSMVFGNPRMAWDILKWRVEIPLEVTLRDLYDHLLRSSKFP